MLRVIYRREFHIYLTALYALRRAKPILTRLGSDEYAATDRGASLRLPRSAVQYTINSHKATPKKEGRGKKPTLTNR
jgi:hypothetical protein